MSQIYWFEKNDARRGCPCLFVDRDGVIVAEVHYLSRPEDVRVLDGAAALIGAARRAGWAVGLITNQAGIGRGYYDWSQFSRVQDEIVARLGAGPAPFDFVAACGSHPEAVDPFYRIADHSWRKPNAGMLRMAAGALDLDLAASALIGDHLSDIRAGIAANLAQVIHVRTGHGGAQRPAVEAFAAQKDAKVRFAEDLIEAAACLSWEIPAR